eukprot:11061014-Ditylum_brightwellii.AAC.1
MEKLTILDSRYAMNQDPTGQITPIMMSPTFTMAGMMLHAVEIAMTTAVGWIQMPLKQYRALSQAINLPVTHGRKILIGHIRCMKQLMNMPD